MNTDRYNLSRLGSDPPHVDLKHNPHDSKADVKNGDSIMQPEHSVRPDQDVLFAWREGLAEAAPSQDLKQQLLQREGELLPRFAEHYGKLKHLPRRVRRSLQRQWRKSLAGIALLFALGATPAMAATINVGGGCTLVDAITAANTDNAIGRCKAGHGPDTIVLPTKSTQTLTRVNNGYVGPSGLPVITSAITIAGNGSTIARSQAPGTPQFRIFILGQNGKLTLKQTKVTGGSLSGQDQNGGGVYRRSGALTLIGCTISGNSAYYGGGVANSLGGTVTISNSTVSGNTADHGGGGIFISNTGPTMASSGVLKVTNSTLSGNTAGSSGGGLLNYGSATVTNSTISGNSAYVGSGVYVSGGDLTLTNSTLSGNSALQAGGGVENFRGTVTLTNSTLSGNSAFQGGGGALNIFGQMFFVDSTVSHNTAVRTSGGVYSAGVSGAIKTNTVLTRTLISGNTALKGAEVYQASGGVLTSNSSLFGHSGLTNAQAVSGGGVIVASGDINATSDGNRPTALNAILNPTLAKNGGPTKTHALVANSPAIDAVGDGSCPPPATDQRGISRPQDGNRDAAALCDIGAFELAPVSGG